MNAQITVNNLLNNKIILNRFKGMPIVAIVEKNIPILKDHLQLLSTHKRCFNLVKKKVVKKFFIKDNLLVVYI